MGAFIRNDPALVKRGMERAYSQFPILYERRNQKGGTLSGGEQQMLAIARALMNEPKLLVLDEPSMGLSPVLVQQVFDIVKEINEAGTTIFMVEQNATKALEIADRGYVLQTGSIIMTDLASNLLSGDAMKAAYLGG
jgi:branched-chain amino acid transport system ATP-binding protein